MVKTFSRGAAMGAEKVVEVGLMKGKIQSNCGFGISDCGLKGVAGLGIGVRIRNWQSAIRNC
jgi:hypothetical protein